MADKVIEVPRPQDFCKHQTSCGERKCSLGWMIAFELTNDYARCVDAWHEAASEIGIPGGVGIGSRNDHPKTTYKQLAKAFELMLVKLGYEIYG